MEHLLNNYIFTSRLCDSFTNIFQKSDRDRGCIFNTLTRWRKNYLDNEIIRSAWTLTPKFIIWNVWKERNRRIFKDEKRTLKCLFEQILTQHKETVSTIMRNLPKNPPSDADMRVLRHLGLKGLLPQGMNKKVRILDTKQDYWNPPP